MITYILYFLITPDKLIDNLNSGPTLDNISDFEEKIIKSDDCARKVIAKKYLTKKELEKDNVQEIFFDSALDETPYDIYKKYKNEKNKYSEKDFREYLKHSLIEIHHCPLNQVNEIVENMISGKKKVREGEYAVLVEIPNLFKSIDKDKLTDKEKQQIKIEGELKKRYTYYKRVKNKWVMDVTIQDENGDLFDKFCNSVSSCKKNPEINVCESKDLQIKQIDNLLYKSIGEKMNELREKIESIKKIILIKNILKDSMLNKKYEIGQDIKDDQGVQSPFIKIRQYILAEPDFSRKQQYIIRFYTKFCREADFKEERHWGYCRETNTKLFPRSLYELAVAFINHQYSLKLDNLIYEIGELSSDGDSVIDKYTGYVLKRIDDSIEEGYDEGGFKITTNAIIEKDSIDIVLKEMDQLKGKTFSNEIAEKVYKVFRHLKLKTGIKDENENIEDFVMKQSIRFLCNPAKMPTECIFNDNIFTSKKDFEKQQNEKAKKRKDYKKISYDNFINRNIITLTVGMFLVAIQTSIPGIKPRNTYPKCEYSYSGFPMTSDNELGGITFLACIVKSSAKENLLIRDNKELWESIIKDYQLNDFIKEIRQTLNFLIVSADTKDVFLENLYIKKKEYLLLEKGNNYSDYLEQTKKWSLFLPPIVPFSIIKSIKSLGDGFESELNKQIIHGNKQQHEMLDSYKSKIKQMTYGIVERVRIILKTSKNLLNLSYIQTACCNENNIINPIQYFIEKDAEIRNYIVLINKYSYDYFEKSKAKSNVLFFDSGKISIDKKSFGTNYTKELIYGAYIHYCNYDNNLPIEDDLKDICNKKPDNYDNSLTLVEKIDILEKNKIIYNEDLQIHRLMKKIHLRNLIELPKNKRYNIIEKFANFLTNDNDLIDEELKTILLNIVSNCNSKKTQIVPIEEIDNIENKKLYNLIEFLEKANRKKYINIGNYLKNNTRSSSKELSFLENIQSSKTFVKSDEQKENPSEKNYQFVKNSIKDMIQIYPNLIINRSDPIHLNVFEHWNFSQNHSKKLNINFKEFYGALNPFFNNDDTILHSYLNYITERLSFYNDFIDLLPIYSEIEMNESTCFNLFNKTSIDKLLKYIWYSVLEDYMNIANTSDFIKKQRDEQIKENQQKMNDAQDIYLSVDNSVFKAYEDIYDSINPGLSRNDLILFNTKVANILKVFLSMQQEMIETIDYDYERIKNETFILSEKEKIKLVEKIGNYNKFDQDVDKLLRKLKLNQYYVADNALSNPDYFESKDSSVPIEAFEGENPVIIDYGNNNRDIEITEDNEVEDIGNYLNDPDDMNEDQYGETRLDDDEYNYDD